MSDSLCWLAVRGKVTDLILQELQLKRTGARQDKPSAIAGLDVPPTWYIVIMKQETELLRNEILSEMSLECECVACFVEDASKVSSAVGWKHGKKIWSVL